MRVCKYWWAKLGNFIIQLGLATCNEFFFLPSQKPKPCRTRFLITFVFCCSDSKKRYKIKVLKLAISWALASFEVPATRIPPTVFLVATLWSVDFDLIKVIDSKRLLQMHLTAASLRQMAHEEKLLSLDWAIRRTAVMCSLHHWSRGKCAG